MSDESHAIDSLIVGVITIELASQLVLELEFLFI